MSPPGETSTAVPTSLQEWLDFQQSGHGGTIVLGLDRVEAVWRALTSAPPARHVIVVAGTNGKGSTVAIVDAIARAAGLRTGAYTSPHLQRYNERIRIDGEEVGDADLCEAFERIEAVRRRLGVPLTYFEYGTLAALLIFSALPLDVAILEIGLGGRLDAVNVIDADVAIVSSVDLDHQDWLGPDRETIAAEKAGIFRRDAVAVIAERDPPATLKRIANAVGARTLAAGRDYDWQISADAQAWEWSAANGVVIRLPMPGIPGAAQFGNASAAIVALRSLPLDPPLSDRAIREGIAGVQLSGRLQRTCISGREVVLDVAHNAQAARELAAWLRGVATGSPFHAVFGSLDDKDTAAIVDALSDRIAHWHCGSLDQVSKRGLGGPALVARVAAAGGMATAYPTIDHAWRGAMAAAPAGDPVIAFGSFLVVEAMLGLIDASARLESK